MLQKLFQENNLRKIGWVIAIGNMIMMFLSAAYFLFIAKFTIVEWFFANICFFSTLIFLAGFFFKNRAIMSVSIPFLAYFGTGGMFIFGWQGMMISAQINHIFMTIAIIYTILEDVKIKEWKQPILGFFIGLIVFLFFLPIHQNYIKTHPELVEKFGDSKFEKNINN